MNNKLLASAVAIGVTVGASGLALTMNSEGLVTHTYRDPVRIKTACYGHTGPELKMGQDFTPDQCRAILKQDIYKHQAYVVPGRVGNCINSVPLNQNQIDALTDFVFNVGGTKFCSSHMAMKLRSKDYQGASLEFHKWAFATLNGKRVKLSGLIKRRTAEERLFDTPMPHTTPEAPYGAVRGVAGQ